MEKLIFSKNIYLSKSNIPKAGMGVFASKKIKKGKIVEVCPVLVLPQKDYNIIKKTILRNYYFMWGRNTSAICFGFGSYYNHSYEPNATYRKKIKEKAIDFVAIKDINKLEEITVNYNYGNPESTKRLWIKGIKPAV